MFGHPKTRTSIAARFRAPVHETLAARRLLVADICLAPPIDPAENAAEVRVLAAEPAEDVGDFPPQYVVHHPPRLQVGNAPLIGTPAFRDSDQVELVWQTKLAGDGEADSFAVSYRKAGDADWTSVELGKTNDLELDSRMMHSATIEDLAWDTSYEYRVQHLRGEDTLTTYQESFRTRLRVGDTAAFSFAAYGDSARSGNFVANFNQVQRQINRTDPDFSVLLGDNFYTFGTHFDADSRMTASSSPDAVSWTSRKIDYPAIGNHDIFVQEGKATRDLFSVPIPVEGENAFVSIPDDEFPEHSYSFDYGDMHFVTFDSNPVDDINPVVRTQRIEQMVDFVVRDLAASDAKWKVVFAHHPFIGTEKRQSPNDVYFQTIVEKLSEADVDLLMLGHSHTYSWTYPITGFEDTDESETIEIDEVSFLEDTDRVYEKGSGLIQFVSGAGGGSLRSPTYEEPVFAQAYSLAENTGPLEYGFARVDVTPSDITVSYISAATGKIVGDLNQNGVWDEGEEHFGQFSIVDSSVDNGDLQPDGVRDAADIDLLAAAIRGDIVNERLDLNADGQVDTQDRDFLLRTYFGTTYGDANLDGKFNSSDLVAAFIPGDYEDDVEGNSTWSTGDWNGDGDFDSADLVLALTAGGFTTI